MASWWGNGATVGARLSYKNRKWRNWWRIATARMYFWMKFKVVVGFACYIQCRAPVYTRFVYWYVLENEARGREWVEYLGWQSFETHHDARFFKTKINASDFWSVGEKHKKKTNWIATTFWILRWTTFYVIFMKAKAERKKKSDSMSSKVRNELHKATMKN